MKRFILGLIIFLAKILLKIRYRVSYKGFDTVKKELKGSKKGILFLANHPAVIVDPLITSIPLIENFQTRPLVIEYMYYNPAFHGVMKLIGALPIPNFSTSFNVIKVERAKKSMNEIHQALNKGESFLIYPSGTTKVTGREILGGAFAVANIIQENQDLHICCIRTEGLWGSAFSRALTNGDSVDLQSVFTKAFWTTLKNLIFFVPKRNITCTYELVDKTFPYKGAKNEINEYLENWFNRPYEDFPKKEEPIQLVSYSAYGIELPQIQPAKEESIDTSDLSKELQDDVLEKIALLSKRPKSEIKLSHKLSEDLGLDSLDMAELLAFLEERFDVSGIVPGDLTSVTRVLLVASHKFTRKEEKEPEWNLKSWNKKKKQKRLFLQEGKTIIEVFFKQCDDHLFRVVAADTVSGIWRYIGIKLAVILLSEKLPKLPGTRVGILMPATMITQVLILALQLAKKTPVMINWTTGAKHLSTVIDAAQIKSVITSWAFIDNLDNVDFSPIQNIVTILEEVKIEISLRKKLKGLFLALLPTNILKQFSSFDGLKDVKPQDEAVLLFTSGTESLPKGVPLTHYNILQDQRATIQCLSLYSDDILLSNLPPFHSFGFTVTGIMPILIGMKTVFYPNPTEAKRIAKGIGRWKPSILCSAPTFLKNILLAADQKSCASLRLIVSGAEKAPEELFHIIQDRCPQVTFAEGYGITECSPVLTVNADGSEGKGVGKAINGTFVQVVNPENHEESIPDGHTGLILVYGPQVFSGYLNKSITSPFVEKEGIFWYNTGDLGFLDNEKNLHLCGRLKRFIKIGGEMLSIGAVEDAIQKEFFQDTSSIPLFAVVSYSDEMSRPQLVLFSTKTLDLGLVNTKIRKQGLSNLVKISRIYQVEEIPMTATGKTAWRLLEQKLAYILEKEKGL